MSAHGFVSSSVNEIATGTVTNDNDTVSSLQEDIKIIGSSLYFIDDFLRSMLDIHASAANALAIKLAPADLMKDVLEPVRSILHQRDGRIDVSVECELKDGLEPVCMTDTLRLKQVSMIHYRSLHLIFGCCIPFVSSTNFFVVSTERL